MIKCHLCGSKLETLPKHCSKNMVYNERLQQFECYMGELCGYVPINQVLCESCKRKVC